MLVRRCRCDRAARRGRLGVAAAAGLASRGTRCTSLAEAARSVRSTPVAVWQKRRSRTSSRRAEHKHCQCLSSERAWATSVSVNFPCTASQSATTSLRPRVTSRLRAAAERDRHRPSARRRQPGPAQPAVLQAHAVVREPRPDRLQPGSGGRRMNTTNYADVMNVDAEAPTQPKKSESREEIWGAVPSWPCLGGSRSLADGLALVDRQHSRRRRNHPDSHMRVRLETAKARG